MLNFGKIYHAFVGPHLSALLIGASLFLSACSMGDVQFEGKLFEAVGLDGSLTAKRDDPKVKERSPLVLPPQTALPEPGKRAVVEDTMNWPDDPDLKRKQQASLLDQERKKYCSEAGLNREDPYFDEEKAKHCGSLLSKTLNKSFGRADKDE